MVPMVFTVKSLLFPVMMKLLMALIEQRILSNRAMRIIGEATGLQLILEIGESPIVLISWDRRDGNAELVDALQSGLGAAGCRTMRIGEVPTRESIMQFWLVLRMQE